MRVVLGHLGLGWIYLPYSSYIGMFLSILFLCSGYLTLFLYQKRKTTVSYLVRRLSGILIPFYLMYGGAVGVAFLVSGRTDNLTWGHLVRFLIVAPTRDEFPYHLDQIWFLRVIIVCILLSPFIFRLAQGNRNLLLIPVAVAFGLATVQTLSPIHRNFFFFGYNLYQCLVYGAYFFIGSFVYSVDWRPNRRLIQLLFGIALLIAVISFPLTNGHWKLGDHAYSPDLYYFPLGIAGSLVVLGFVPVVERLLNGFRPFSWLLDYSGKHSYGIYIGHSYFIVFTEDAFGWKGVIHNPPLAVAKVAFVVAVSMLAAYPITYITGRLREPIKMIF